MGALARHEVDGCIEKGLASILLLVDCGLYPTIELNIRNRSDVLHDCRAMPVADLRSSAAMSEQSDTPSLVLATTT